MAYLEIDGNLAISVNDWCNAGLTFSQFNHDSKKGFLDIYRRGYNGNTLIDLKSIKRPERIAVLENAYGKIETPKSSSIFNVVIDTTARTFYVKYRKPDGSPLDTERIEEYVNRTSIFNALRDGLKKQLAERAKRNKRLNMGEFWSDAAEWFLLQVEKYPCRAIGNARSLKRAFDEWYNVSKNDPIKGYELFVHGNIGNDAARKVSVSTEKLFLALWRTNDKPFVNRVHELYLEFVAGNKELFDNDKKSETYGLVFKPEDFRHKGRALEVSIPTVWNYLKDVVNNTAVYSDRNGNFDYMDKMRPKRKRKPGRYSLSKISMDDVALSRKSVRGWIYKYMAVDVVSGYWFRPDYVVGKPSAQTVINTFRNMFCELSELGLPMPGELEVEYHLMQDFKWLQSAFPFVRFCESPTEKRAEHAIRAFKYGASKDAGHTRGRWFSKSEAYKSIRNKVNGDFVEPTYQPQTIVMDDLADIENHNNELHPLQKTYPGMTRKQVLLSQVNPTLQPIEHWHLYRFIGNETETSIYKNDYLQCNNSEFELENFKMLKRLKPNDYTVTAYWLPEEDGSISRVYVYQGDTYIGEAINRDNFAYNECAIERTDEDRANMEHQAHRVGSFDKFIKEEKSEIPKIGSYKASPNLSKEGEVPVVLAETEQPKGYEETPEFNNTNWAEMAKNSL